MMTHRFFHHDVYPQIQQQIYITLSSLKVNCSFNFHTIILNYHLYTYKYMSKRTFYIYIYIYKPPHFLSYLLGYIYIYYYNYNLADALILDE